MNRVVFDIETLAYPFESFDPEQQSYLLKFAHSDEEKAEAIQRLSLTPFTARVIAIGMLNPDSNQGKVLYESQDQSRVTLTTGWWSSFRAMRRRCSGNSGRRSRGMPSSSRLTVGRLTALFFCSGPPRLGSSHHGI